MSNIKDTLRSIASYYEVNRQVGHTTAVVSGAINTKDTVIIAHNHQSAKDLEKKHSTYGTDGKSIAISSFDSQMRGRRVPITFDNATIHFLCLDALREIENVEGRNNRLAVINTTFKSWLDNSAKEILRLEEENKKLSKENADLHGLVDRVLTLNADLLCENMELANRLEAINEISG